MTPLRRLFAWLWPWIMFAAAVTCWPVDIVWRGLLRQEVTTGRTIRYRSTTGRTLTVPAWYRCDHSTLSPNLFRLGSGTTATALLLASAVLTVCGLALIGGMPVPAWAAWLAWAWACGLALPFSDGQYLHDYAYDWAEWDCGERMTKGAADGVMIAALAREGHPRLILSLYLWGVSTGLARRLWNRHDDGRPLA
jgi:hypothetical protein